MSARRELGFAVAALLASCASTGAHDHDRASVTFGAPGATVVPQRITLVVDAADPRTPPIQVMATMPAGSSCLDVAMSLSLLLEKRGCQATSGQSRVPGYDFSVRLLLPGDARFTNVVVEALNRGAWGPPSPVDLRLVAESLPPAPPPHKL